MTPRTIPTEQIHQALKECLGAYDRRHVLEQLGLRKADETRTFIIKMKVTLDVNDYEDSTDEPADEVTPEDITQFIGDDCAYYLKVAHLEGAEVTQ